MIPFLPIKSTIRSTSWIKPQEASLTVSVVRRPTYIASKIINPAASEKAAGFINILYKVRVKSLRKRMIWYF